MSKNHWAKYEERWQFCHPDQPWIYLSEGEINIWYFSQAETVDLNRGVTTWKVMDWAS